MISESFRSGAGPAVGGRRLVNFTTSPRLFSPKVLTPCLPLPVLQHRGHIGPIGLLNAQVPPASLPGAAGRLGGYDARRRTAAFHDQRPRPACARLMSCESRAFASNTP